MSEQEIGPALTAVRECRSCHAIKALEQFPKRPAKYRDGRDRQCTTCYNARRRTETYRRINRLSARRQHERAAAKFAAKRKRYPRETGAEKMARDPLKETARRKLRWAVRSGKIRKPTNCEDCGVEAVLHGHHSDYTQPLTVCWLCHVCHMRRHRKPDA